MDTTTTNGTETEVTNVDTFGTEAKAAVVLIDAKTGDKRGKLLARLCQVVAADQKESINDEFRTKLADLRKDTPADQRNGERYLAKVAEIEAFRQLTIIRQTLADLESAAAEITERVPDLVSAAEVLLERPRHTMAHGTMAADFVADLCGVTIDTKRAVSASVNAAKAKYRGEVSA